MKSVSRSVYRAGKKGGVFDRGYKIIGISSNAFRRGRACVAYIGEKDEASVCLQKMKM